MKSQSFRKRLGWSMVEEGEEDDELDDEFDDEFDDELDDEFDEEDERRSLLPRRSSLVFAAAVCAVMANNLGRISSRWYLMRGSREEEQSS